MIIKGSNYKAKGFTLAEVLVTLAVIGIVASITIPSLMKNFEQMELKAKWKKAFSEINQAFLHEVSNSSWEDIMAFSYQQPEDQRPVRNILNNYFRTVKECIYPNNFGNCWAESDDFKQLDGNTPNTTLFDDGGFILIDGTIMVFEDNFNGTSNNHKYIWVDVNGFKKPNVIGKDIFGVEITLKGLRALGSNDSFVNTCNTTGYGCSSEYLYN